MDATKERPADYPGAFAAWMTASRPKTWWSLIRAVQRAAVAFKPEDYGYLGRARLKLPFPRAGYLLAKGKERGGKKTENN